MIIINSLNESRFTLNNVQYFKNYTTRVAGDKLTIYNAYDNKDVLVPLTPFDQFRVNGSVYETIDELQIAIIGICYTRTTLEEGSPSSQNNVARLLSIGIVDIIGSDVNATSTFYAESVAAKLSTIEFTITATEAPVIVYAVIDDNGDGINSLYSYFFTGGKGTYTNVLSYQLLYINDKKYTVDDIENNPTANIISLGDLPTGDYLTKANSAQRDFNGAGELDENGNLISYYLSYTTDNVLYFVQFVGEGGSYNGTLTANDFVSTTNSNVVADINYENVLQTGNFASIGAIHKDSDTDMITEFHGSGFDSTLGDYTQKFLVDVPAGNYTITFPAAAQNDNVVYESTLHEGLNSLGLQAVTDTGNVITKNNVFETFFLLKNGTSNAELSIKTTDDGLISFVNDDGAGVLSNLTSGDAFFTNGNGIYTSVNYNGINLHGDAKISKDDGSVSIMADTNSGGLSGEHDYTPNITDLDYVQKKYVDEQIGSAIPLTGTEEGNPVTGDIELDKSNGIRKIFLNGSNVTSEIIMEDANTGMELKSTQVSSEGFTSIAFKPAILLIETKSPAKQTYLEYSNGVLKYENDESAYYTNRSLVDKEYVDNQIVNNVIPLSGTEEGNPVSGFVEIEDGYGIISNDGGGIWIGKGYDNGGIAIGSDGAVIARADNNPSWVGITYGIDYSDNYTDRSLVDKGYVDDVAIQNLQNVTDTGATTTNTITTGGLSIPTGMLNITDGDSSHYIKGDGTTSSFSYAVKSNFIGSHTVIDGSTEQINELSLVRNAFYQLQNQINANADNTIPLAGTEVSSPVTGDIEIDASTTIGLKADTGGQITFDDTDGVRIQGNAGGVSIGGSTLGVTIDGEGGDIDIVVGSSSKINLMRGLNHDGDGQNSIFHANGGQYEFGGNGNFKGIEYTEDYSSNYTNRSLVDKEYTDTKENKGKITQSISSTSAIDFTSYKQFGTRTTPITVDVTLDTTDATEGIIQIIYHNAASFTPPAGTTIVGNTPYVPNVLNMICMRYTSDTVEIWYSQDQ